ncbi:MAG: hypothetical protein LBS57_12925 [Treponema sp.]|jgi:hypothetical protein|nr:hypothetical protein [Treponema sp.]
MSLFCLLYVPLFYLFRRSVSPTEGGGGVWALLLGSIVAIFQFFLGYMVTPGGFGLSRWMSGFVDIVSLPALIPILVYLVFIFFKVFPDGADFTNFALLWLIPIAALRALSWSSLGDPILLVLVPLLWTAIAAGIPFFIGIITGSSRWYIVVPSTLCILGLPLAAATSYWALFSQRALIGFLLFFVTIVPMTVSLTLAFLHGE